LIKPLKFTLWNYSQLFRSVQQEDIAASEHVPAIDYAMFVSEQDEAEYQVSLTVKYSAAAADCIIEIMLGISSFFKFPTDLESDKIDEFLHGNCLPITYSFCRGLVANMTGISPVGPILLPSINFRELEKRKTLEELKALQDQSE
jgi:preprotein translocase subunit SecB